MGYVSWRNRYTLNSPRVGNGTADAKPTKMSKVQEEVRTVIGKKAKIEEEDILQMDYLKCVIKETLRAKGLPGRAFALIESEYVLAISLYWFDWKLPRGTCSEDLDITENY
ncbi:unnamed protein product, partial [Thlaspi arvense]